MGQGNKYDSGKSYTLNDGDSIIPARNPEAGFGGGLFASRYAGSQLTEMHLEQKGLFPSVALTEKWPPYSHIVTCVLSM